MKVLLQQVELSGFRHECMLNLRSSLPFFQGTNPTRYVHRVRSATSYYSDAPSVGGKYKHTVYRFWCGMHGSCGKKRGGGMAELVASPDEGRVLCATCEGRAIGAGMDGARIIAGRDVMFNPRDKT